VGLSALALVGLLGGCGNEKADFRVQQLNPLVKRMGEERATLAAVLRTSRPRQARDTQALRDQLSRLGAAMQRIATLKPPDGVDGPFRAYTRANAAVLRSLRSFVEAFASGRSALQQEAARQTGASLARASQAQTKLQHALT
jgi:cytochrome c556